MAKRILVSNIQVINAALLDQQLKTAAPTDCFGLSMDTDSLGQIVGDVVVYVSDTIDATLVQTLKNIVVSHDPTQKTTEQQAEQTGKTDTATLLAAADNALTQLAAKRATFATTPNLTNAAPLLLEITDDLMAVIKMLKFVARRLN